MIAAVVIIGCVIAWVFCSLVVAHAIGACARTRDRVLYGVESPHPHDPTV